MKTITNEIRAKVMAPYVGVAEIKHTGIKYNIEFHYDHLTYIRRGVFINPYIKVKPLLSITDEDAKLLNAFSAKEFINIFNAESFNDELRQLGYACNFRVLIEGKVVNYSVEDLVELGIYKLI